MSDMSQPPSGPPPGGTPPQQPPGGQPPPGGPPPSDGASGQSQSPSAEYRIGDAFNYGWTKFQENIGALVLGLLAYIAVFAVLSVLWILLVGALFGIGDGDGFFVGFVSSMFSGLIGLLGFYIVQAQFTRAALKITYGEKVEVRHLFETDGLDRVALGALLLTAAFFIGALLCFFPGIIIGIFAMFWIHFLLDKRLSVLDSFKASVSLVNRNLATLIGFGIAAYIAMYVGFLACLIGALVSIPVTVIAQAYTYRKLQGEPVAA